MFGGGKLLFNTFLYSLLSIVIYCLLNKTLISPFSQVLYFIKFGTVSTNPPLWFLFTLFLVKCIDSILKGNVLLLLAIFMTLGYLGARFELLPYWVFNTCIGLFYYEVGKFCKKRTFSHKHGIFLLIGFIPLIIITGYPVVDVWKNELYNGCYFMWFIYMALLSIFVTELSSLYNSPILILNWAGRNALIIFATHWIVLSSLKTIISYI